MERHPSFCTRSSISSYPFAQLSASSRESHCPILRQIRAFQTSSWRLLFTKPVQHGDFNLFHHNLSERSSDFVDRLFYLLCSSSCSRNVWSTARIWDPLSVTWHKFAFVRAHGVHELVHETRPLLYESCQLFSHFWWESDSSLSIFR